MGRKQGDPFLVIGVTGGIGAGKSTVSALLKQMADRRMAAGAERVDADALARAATEPGQPALVEIAETFGRDLIGVDGRLDRVALSDVVFSDPEKRKNLEAIIHTCVVEAIDARIARRRAEGWSGLLVLDVPIPVQRGFLDVCDEVWVVAADETVRVSRVCARSGLSEAQVRARMAAQPDAAFWQSVADRKLRNDGTEDALPEKVTDALEAVLVRFRMK